MKRLSFLLIAAVLILQVNGQNILYGPTTTYIQNVRAISNNGIYVVGQTSAGLREAYTWDISSGNEIKVTGGSFADTRVSEAFGVTDDNKLVGDFADPELLLNDEPIRSAGFWENENWTGLGLGIETGAPVNTLQGSHASAVSNDGKIIAGFCRAFVGEKSVVYPYSWTYDETTQAFVGEEWAMPENIYQGASIAAMSGDGSVAVGWTNLSGGSARTGILWTSKTDYKVFEYGEEDDYSDFLCISNNGRYAGFRHNATSGVYDIKKDEYTLIPNGLLVNAVSDNGMAVGAYKNNFNVLKGFVWSSDLGFTDFGEFVATYASDITFPVNLQNAFDPQTFNPYAVNAITPDGQSITILAGYAFVLKLDAPIIIVPYPENVSVSVSRSERNNVVLTWNAPKAWTEELVEYIIYRDNEQIATVDAGFLTYTDLNVDAGYRQYSVQAVYEDNISKKTEQVEAIVVDTYQIPFFFFFESYSFKTNYWTPVDVEYKNYWHVIQGGGVEAGSGGAFLEVAHSQSEPFSATLISKPLDATEASNVYLTYMVFAHYFVDSNLTMDKLFVDVSTDGNVWTNASEYTFQELKGWKAEILDISDIAIGEVINIRFRVEGENHSINTKRYFFVILRISTTTPE
jgi:hypothetical protein